MMFTKAMTQCAKVIINSESLSHIKMASLSFNLAVQSGSCITAKQRHGLVSDAIAAPSGGTA